MRKKLAIALLVAWAGSAIPGCIFASLDENRPPTQVAGSGVPVAWFLPMVAAAGWCAFRALKGHRRKEAFDKVLLSCTIVFVLGFSLTAAVAFLNKCLDHSGMAMEMTVTDVFILRRTDHHDERLVAVSLPAQAGGTAVWLIANPEIALAAFPIGSKARIISQTDTLVFRGASILIIGSRSITGNCPSITRVGVRNLQLANSRQLRRARKKWSHGEYPSPL